MVGSMPLCPLKLPSNWLRYHLPTQICHSGFDWIIFSTDHQSQEDFNVTVQFNVQSSQFFRFRSEHVLFYKTFSSHSGKLKKYFNVA